MQKTNAAKQARIADGGAILRTIAPVRVAEAA